ncbi:MAG: tRNA uridine-5-carboxymethylaminomethyl(34) synthesis enzyme MnmG [Clostridia bacterium]|nr:tRNA uridine-5-carboxymethylaminomethyl(34) synthesis enzyme MnmG [Clostridia bacterium]
MNEFDVIVAGAGHAGCEAALAAARTGLKCALFTLSLDAVANMPCNPSVGGSGKGHLVFEIDALGGEMGRLADRATIQSRTLNTSKGAAVRSKRVQTDRRLYSAMMKETLEREPNLRLIQSEVTALLTDRAAGEVRVVGVTAEPGGDFFAKAVILSTGTYLGGLTHIGEVRREEGPDKTANAPRLTASLREAGISVLRFKTGTPPRIHRRSIDFSALGEQEGEAFITPFSYRTDPEALNGIEQVKCHVAYTNEETHRIIRENMDRSPLFSGKIRGTGPRYCPSIEDKVRRFAERTRHQLFVEPMGRNTEEIYLQGFSSSLPADVQYKMLRSIRGFEEAEIMRYAYAIEYDLCDPAELSPTLEFKAIRGLFGAGQFNGTSGYEEAAAQGVLAGINASLSVRGGEMIVLPRYSSYIGTMIDDLVTKGITEPYRIMTSRSEFRLLLRQDNARFRLLEYGRRGGLIDDERYAATKRDERRSRDETERLRHVNFGPARINPLLESKGETPVSSGISADEVIKRPGVTFEDVVPLDPESGRIPRALRDHIETEIKYEGYIKRQFDEANRQKKAEDAVLPADIDYSSIRGLRIEAAQKLGKVRPATIGMASRISGVNPADVSVLMIWLAARGKAGNGARREDDDGKDD